MKSGRDLGVLLLAIWLIATGLLPLLGVSLPGEAVILAILAIAAGILLLTGGLTGISRAKLSANLGSLLLSIWLVVQGALELLKVNFPQSGLVMAVLALAAGMLMLLRR